MYSVHLYSQMRRAVGWLRGEYKPVVTDALFDMDVVQLQAEIVTLRRRILKLFIL